MIGIVYSTRDPAGSGVADYIAREMKPREVSICRNAYTCLQGDNFTLTGFHEDVLDFNFLDERLPLSIEFYVILSRHSSIAGVKSYTVHTTGNFTYEYSHGANPRELGIAYPSIMWFLLRSLHRYSIELSRVDYEVSYEASHHGPTSLSKPIVFIEIGSGIDEWRDLVNHEVIGRSIISLVEVYPGHISCIPVIGIGGGHYPQKHTELALRNDICYGHIASKHVLDYVDEEILNLMINRSYEKPIELVVEKKSTRREHRELVEQFSRVSSLKIRYI